MQNIRIGVNTSMAAGRREVEQLGEVALLEDPHHRAEGRGEAQHVQTRAP